MSDDRPVTDDSQETGTEFSTAYVEPQKFVLRLFVTGMTPRSLMAIRQTQAICKECLRDLCELEIVDIYQNPSQAVLDQVIASPTLLKVSPHPQLRVIGSLADKQKLIMSLGISNSDTDGTPGGS